MKYNAYWKVVQQELGVKVDGYAGDETRKALASRLKCGAAWEDIQRAVGTEPDGLPGNNTIHAIKVALGLLPEGADNAKGWKAVIVTQADVRTGRSVYGRAGDESYLVSVPLPANYPLTYEGKAVRSIRVHGLVADRVESALKEVADFYERKYGNLIEAQMKAPAIYVYGGSYNDRSTVGGGVKSIHAWGLALDFDPGENWYSRKKVAGARLARVEYEAFFDIWEAHGFYSLGRRSDVDWMHIQAASWV